MLLHLKIITTQVETQRATSENTKKYFSWNTDYNLTVQLELKSLTYRNKKA